MNIFKVVDRNGVEVNVRNNDRKNLYFEKRHAQSAATQFNDVTVFKNGEDTKLEGFPYRVVSGVVLWNA